MNLAETLEASAEAAKLQDKDHAALQLARIYAIRIDIAVINKDNKTITDMGAKLHALLKDLGMTQAASAAKQIEGGAADDTNPAAATFARLRANRD